MERFIVLGDVEAAAASGWRRISSASARVYDRYTADADHRPDHTQHDTEHDDAGDAEAEDVHREQEDTGDTDGDGDADALHDRLDCEALVDGTTWYAAFTDVRVVPSVRTMSARRATPTSAKRPSVAAPGPATTSAIDREKRGDDRRVQDQSDA